MTENTNTIRVTATIELPDDVDAVGGTLLADGDGGAIANITYAGGSESAWWMSPDTRKWNPSVEGDWFHEGEQAYVVVGGVWNRDHVAPDVCRHVKNLEEVASLLALNNQLIPCAEVGQAITFMKRQAAEIERLTPREMTQSLLNDITTAFKEAVTHGAEQIRIAYGVETMTAFLAERDADPTDVAGTLVKEEGR